VGAETALRWLLLAAMVLVFLLFRPFLDALVIAMVVALLSEPLHARLHARLPKRMGDGWRRGLATALTVALVAVGIIAPAVTLITMVVRELQVLILITSESFEGGAMERLLAPVLENPQAQAWIAEIGDPRWLQQTLTDGARSMLLSLGSLITGNLSELVSGAARLVLKALIFMLAWATLLYQGGELGAWAVATSPLRPEHSRRIYAVFAEFSRNVVLAGLVCGVVQGMVAGVGYWLAGVERPLLFAILTGILAYVPLVGTALVWVPLALLALSRGDSGAALLLTGWSVLLTSSIDNLIKPLIVRGHSDMSPLLVFLGVFGGLAWMGLIGVLVGPVMVAILRELLVIYQEEQARREHPDG